MKGLLAPTLAVALALLLAPTAAGPAAARDQAIARARAFLIAHQNPDGSWGSARRTKELNIYAPAPGGHHAFRAATTALALAALCDTTPVETDDGGAEALARGQAWLLDFLPRLRRANQDAIYNVWGHAYALQALTRLHRRAQDDQVRARLVAAARDQIRRLEGYASINGGWGYYDFAAHTQRPSGSPNSFTTATVLVALHEARELGLAAEERCVRRALQAIQRQRKPDFSYVYSENWRFYPMGDVNRPAGSLGRSQACNLALRLWGDEAVTDAVLRDWLDRLLARGGWLDIGRKRPVPHESWFLVAGYFFYYGHYYAAGCIEQLPAEAREPYRHRLAEALILLQERDGSFWDYPLYDYHQAYGTAFALLSLAR